MIDLTKWQGYPQVKKEWGREIILINSPLYCTKYLVISPGKQCSLHKHNIKDETFYILEGEVLISHGERMLASEVKHVGDCFRVPCGLYHRFGSLGGAILLEVSSHHDEQDVERLIPSGDMLPF